MLRNIVLGCSVTAAFGVSEDNELYRLGAEQKSGETYPVWEKRGNEYGALASAGERVGSGANGMWYPDGVADRTPNTFCSVDMMKEGVVTIDDIRDGTMCHFDPVTRDMCGPPLVMEHIAMNATYLISKGQPIENLFGQWGQNFNTGGDGSSKYTFGDFLHGENITYGLNHKSHPRKQGGNYTAASGGTSGWNKLDWQRGARSDYADDYMGMEDLGILAIDGGYIASPVKNGFPGVTGIDLRGLNSVCGNLGTTEEPLMWYDHMQFADPTADQTSQGFANPGWRYDHHTDADFNYEFYATIHIGNLDNCKFIDMSDLRYAGAVQLFNMPILEDLNLDGLEYVGEINLNSMASLRSVYIPNLMMTTRVELYDGMSNLMDVVMPKLTIINNGDARSGMEIGYNSEFPNLHMIVTGCMHGANSYSNQTGFEPDTKQGTGLQVGDYDYIAWDYMINAFEGTQGAGVDTPVARVDVDSASAAKAGAKDLSVIGDPTIHRMPTWEQIMVGSSESLGNIGGKGPGGINATNVDEALGYGFVEYCGTETFQYDRVHDWGEYSKSFRMNVRCDVNRNPDQLALGHHYAAVVELENAGAHDQVLLAWSRNSGTAMWSPSKKCSHESKLNSIDERAGQMARGRADADGYVKFRQYLEKCDTYVYQAIADPNSADCKLSKMVYGQSSRGNALTVSSEALNEAGKGGGHKFDLRPYAKVGNGEWPYPTGTFERISK